MKRKQKTRNLEKSGRVSVWYLVVDNAKVSFVLSGIILALLAGVILIFRRDRAGEYLPLLWPLGVFFLLFLVVIPALKSLYRLKQQEDILGVRYANSSDAHLPPAQRDWFFASARNEFVLLHRDFIQEVNRIFVDKEETENQSAKFYAIEFTDCRGKKRKIRLEHLKSERERFNSWYTAKAALTAKIEEDADDIYLEGENAEA